MNSGHCLYDRSGIVRIRFTRQTDRFEHGVEFRKQGHWIELLRSKEGSPTDDWPPSPAFQEIHSQEIVDGRSCVFAVGKAGSSHWSVSVDSPSDKVLQVDVAARLRVSPNSLGSEYLVIHPARFNSANNSVHLTGQGIRLSVNLDNGVDLSFNDDTLSISPVTKKAAPPITVRWKYLFQFFE